MSNIFESHLFCVGYAGGNFTSSANNPKIKSIRFGSIHLSYFLYSPIYSRHPPTPNYTWATPSTITFYFFVVVIFFFWHIRCKPSLMHHHNHHYYCRNQIHGRRIIQPIHHQCLPEPDHNHPFHCVASTFFLFVVDVTESCLPVPPYLHLPPTTSFTHQRFSSRFMWPRYCRKYHTKLLLLLYDGNRFSNFFIPPP